MGVEENSTPDWLQKIRAATAEKKAEKPAEPETFSFPESDIPEIERNALNPENDEMDALLAGVDILEAYARWCGKTKNPRASHGRTESIMVSCPWHHPDNNPSAWANIDKQVIYCGACNIGGDIFAVAAPHFGIDPRTYQSKENFPRLKKAMCESLGYVITTTFGGQSYISGPGPEEPAAESPQESPQPVEDNTVVAFPGTKLPEQEDEERPIPTIEWEEIVQTQTFLHSYMESTSMDDIAPEFHLWLALVALGFAAGTEQLLADSIPVKPSINALLYGDTGSGKSRAMHPFLYVVGEALPYDSDPFSEPRGTAILPVPSSSEALIRSFSRDLQDPSSMAVIRKVQVRGLIKTDEFASFVSKASRPGNPMKQTMVDLFDVIDQDVKYNSVSSGTVTSKAPFCQMVTSTQPQATHEFLRRSDLFSGFLNRFIPVMGKPRRPRIAYGGFQYDMTDPIAFLKDVHQWSATSNLMKLDGAPLQAWEDFFHGELQPVVTKEANPMMSRIDLFLKKLIVLFTVNAKETQPTEQTVWQATSLFRYLVQTFKIFSGDLSYDVAEECRNVLLEAAKESKDGIRARDLKRVLSQFPAKMIADTVKLMLQLGELHETVSDGKRGPKSVRYKYAD